MFLQLPPFPRTTSCSRSLSLSSLFCHATLVLLMHPAAANGPMTICFKTLTLLICCHTLPPSSVLSESKPFQAITLSDCHCDPAFSSLRIEDSRARKRSSSSSWELTVQHAIQASQSSDLRGRWSAYVSLLQFSLCVLHVTISKNDKV